MSSSCIKNYIIDLSYLNLFKANKNIVLNQKSWTNESRYFWKLNGVRSSIICVNRLVILILRQVLNVTSIHYDFQVYELSVVEYGTTNAFTVERSCDCEELFSGFYRRLTMMNRRLRYGYVVCSDIKSSNGESKALRKPWWDILSPPCKECRLHSRYVRCDSITWSLTGGAASPIHFTYQSLNPVPIEKFTDFMKGSD